MGKKKKSAVQGRIRISGLVFQAEGDPAAVRQAMQNFGAVLGTFLGDAVTPPGPAIDVAAKPKSLSLETPR